MSEAKTKYAIYLYPSQMEEIKSLMEQANAKSQSEFVSDAIRFYIGYLQQGKNVNYLAPIIAQYRKEHLSDPVQTGGGGGHGCTTGSSTY